METRCALHSILAGSAVTCGIDDRVKCGEKFPSGRSTVDAAQITLSTDRTTSGTTARTTAGTTQLTTG